MKRFHRKINLSHQISEEKDFPGKKLNSKKINYILSQIDPNRPAGLNYFLVLQLLINYLK